LNNANLILIRKNNWKIYLVGITYHLNGRVVSMRASQNWCSVANDSPSIQYLRKCKAV